MVPLYAKPGLYMKELVSGIASVGEMVVLRSSMGTLDGLDIKSVSGISSVRGMAILGSSMEKLDELDMKSASGISSVRGMAISTEKLDGLDMREPVSAVSSVWEVVSLISSMDIESQAGGLREWVNQTVVLVSAEPRPPLLKCPCLIGRTPVASFPRSPPFVSNVLKLHLTTTISVTMSFAFSSQEKELIVD